MSFLKLTGSDALKVACSGCNLRELCLPLSLADEQIRRLDELVGAPRAVARGDVLFQTGDPFRGFFAIRTGFFKTSTSTEDGRDQVTGFQMAGEMLGLDGLSADRHACNAVALEDSTVCTIPYENLESLSRELPDLQRMLHRVMSRELVRDHSVMLLLGSMRAEERLATFLLDLAKRLRGRGFSMHEMVLRMTREEIGSYLGLKLETVSRMFSRFQEEGVLEVRQRQIRIVDQAALQRLAGDSRG